MKYIIVSGRWASQLQEIVQESIDEGGYMPVGGVCIDPSGTFYQALAKK